MTEKEKAIAYGKRVIDLGLNDETQAFCELAISALSENRGEWIPISSIDEIPKEGAYWVTFEYENGHRETSSIGWDSDREYWCDSEGWSMDKDDQKLITAYMPYFEPEPYQKGGE